MKIVVLGLDCAAPEILFGDERLENIRCLMDAGCYGRLESIIPPITVPAWICMATGQDPGMLGVYGFRNRADRSYDRLQIVNSRSIDAVAIWDQVAREGGKSVIIGVPPISVPCFAGACGVGLGWASVPVGIGCPGIPAVGCFVVSCCASARLAAARATNVAANVAHRIA